MLRTNSLNNRTIVGTDGHQNSSAAILDTTHAIGQQEEHEDPEHPILDGKHVSVHEAAKTHRKLIIIVLVVIAVIAIIVGAVVGSQSQEQLEADNAAKLAFASGSPTCQPGQFLEEGECRLACDKGCHECDKETRECSKCSHHWSMTQNST